MQRKRSERVERSFAHVCETGGARRTWLRGIDKVRKRYLVSAMARNLGLLMRSLFGVGTARGLQGQGGLADAVQFALQIAQRRLVTLGIAQLAPQKAKRPAEPQFVLTI